MVSGGGEAREIAGMGVLFMSIMFRLRRRLGRVGGGLGSMAITVGCKQLIDCWLTSSGWREQEKQRTRGRENEERGVEERRETAQDGRKNSAPATSTATTATSDTSGTTVYAQ